MVISSLYRNTEQEKGDRRKRTSNRARSWNLHPFTELQPHELFILAANPLSPINLCTFMWLKLCKRVEVPGSSSVAGPFSPIVFLLSSVSRNAITTFPPAQKEPEQAQCTCSFILFSIVHNSIYHVLSAAPSAPLNLTFPPGGVLNDSITLTWTSPDYSNGVVHFYQLLQSSYREGVVVNATAVTTTIVLSDLTPGTQYNFSVRAFTVDFGPFSAQLSVHTADGEDTCRTIFEGESQNEINFTCTYFRFFLLPSLVQCPQYLKMSRPVAMGLHLCL